MKYVVRSMTCWFASMCLQVGPAEAGEQRVFQNQLHTFSTDTESVIQHARQMGYDYILGTFWSKARAEQGVAAGLKVLFDSTAGDEAKWLRFNNPGGKGSSRSPSRVNDQSIPSQLYAEIKKTLCMRDPAAADTDLKKKYYIAPKYESDNTVLFYNNYRCKSGIDLMVRQNEQLYQLHGGAAVYSGLFLDQVISLNVEHIPSCQNSCLNDPRETVYPDQASGQFEYIRRMREHFKNTLGVEGISGNPWRIDKYSGRHNSAPFDLLYNESGKKNSSYSWSSVPPTVVAVQQPHGKNNDYLYALRTAGVALEQRSWFGWYGEANPKKVTNAVQLAHALPNWDNLENTEKRQWNSSDLVYRSSKNYADPHIIYGRHPKTGKLFVVFLDTAGVLPLRSGEAVREVRRANSLFLEADNGAGDLRINNGQVTLANTNQIGQGYILTTTSATAASESSSAPVAKTAAAQRVLIGSLVQLDGGDSTDADGDLLTYTWTLTAPAGSQAELSSPEVVQPTFVADQEGAYTVELQVQDGYTSSPPSIVTIVATDEPLLP